MAKLTTEKDRNGTVERVRGNDYRRKDDLRLDDTREDNESEEEESSDEGTIIQF